MKTLASVCRAVFVCVAVLLGAAAKLLAFFAAPARRETVDNERGAGMFGRDDISRADLGAFDRDDMPGEGYTVHGREPITLGPDGERIGVYSGAPIIHF
jgi:hypothetical protein